MSEMEDVRYNEWEHYGDNDWVDVEIPSRLGIKAMGLDKKELLPIESDFLSHHADDARWQYLIGASANARINCEYKEIKDIRAYKYGTTLIAPVTVGYISWILKQAYSCGLCNLYFIARDGYLLKATADKIIERNNYNINTHYLYGSRKAWRCAVFGDENIDLADYLRHTDYDNGSIAELAARFDLSAEEFNEYIPSEYNSTDFILDTEKRDQLNEYLQSRRD